MKNDPRRADVQEPATQNPNGPQTASQQDNVDQWSAQQSSNNHPNAQFPGTKRPPVQNAGTQGPGKTTPDEKKTSTPNPMTPDRHSKPPASHPSGNENPSKPPLEFPGKPQRDMPLPDRERSIPGDERPKGDGFPYTGGDVEQGVPQSKPGEARGHFYSQR